MNKYYHEECILSFVMHELFYCRSSVAQLFLTFEKQISWLLPVTPFLCVLGCFPLCHLFSSFPAVISLPDARTLFLPSCSFLPFTSSIAASPSIQHTADECMKLLRCHTIELLSVWMHLVNWDILIKMISSYRRRMNTNLLGRLIELS